MNSSEPPSVLTHYYRPFCRPLQSLTRLAQPEVAQALGDLAQHEALPYRLTQPGYLSERMEIEERMRLRLVAKGGRPQLSRPHYFVLGEFSLWEDDDSLKVQIPVASVPAECLSFTLTDSVFNYRDTSLRGIPIPKRSYHGELYTVDELPALLKAHDLPTDEWRSDPQRHFEVYVEAQVWSDPPVQHLL